MWWFDALIAGVELGTEGTRSGIKLVSLQIRGSSGDLHHNLDIYSDYPYESLRTKLKRRPTKPRTCSSWKAHFQCSIYLYIVLVNFVILLHHSMLFEDPTSDTVEIVSLIYYLTFILLTNCSTASVGFSPFLFARDDVIYAQHRHDSVSVGQRIDNVLYRAHWGFRTRMHESVITVALNSRTRSALGTSLHSVTRWSINLSSMRGTTSRAASRSCAAHSLINDSPLQIIMMRAQAWWRMHSDTVNDLAFKAIECLRCRFTQNNGYWTNLLPTYRINQNSSAVRWRRNNVM